MKHFKRLLCLMLALLMIALALAACGGNEEPKDDDKTQDTTGTDAPATERDGSTHRVHARDCFLLGYQRRFC